MESKEVLTAAEVAAALRCSVRHVSRLFERGELEGYRSGSVKGVRIYRRAVEAFRQDRSNKKAPTPPVKQEEVGARKKRAAEPRLEEWVLKF